MKKLNKVAMLFATAALATAAGAQVKAANGGNVIDNWQNGTGEHVWKNGTNELSAPRSCCGSCSRCCCSRSRSRSRRCFEGDLRC